MSDLIGIQIVGFLTHRLKYFTPNLSYLMTEFALSLLVVDPAEPLLFAPLFLLLSVKGNRRFKSFI